MNLMYFKNLRGEREGGIAPTTTRHVRSGGIDGTSSSMQGVGALGSFGQASRQWFTGGAGLPLAVSSSGLSGIPGPRPVTTLIIPGGSFHSPPSSSTATTTATIAPNINPAMNDSQPNMNPHQHHSSNLRTHLLMDLHTGSAGGAGGGGTSAGGGGGGGGGGPRNQHLDYDDQHERGSGTGSLTRGISSGTARKLESTSNSAGTARNNKVRNDLFGVAEAALASGTRSVRSGLYDTEVCLSVSGLGNIRGTLVTGSGGRTGKQVSFGRRSPNGHGSDREDQQQRSTTSGGKPDNANNTGSLTRSASRPSRDRSLSNKENDSCRLPVPRSSSLVSKRTSPDRGRSTESRSSGGGSRNRNNTSSVTEDDDFDTQHTYPPLTSKHHRSKRDSSLCSRLGDSDLSSVEPEDVNLNHVSRDCFIIPVYNVHRFLPEGVSLPQDSGRSEMNVMEVADPQLVVLLHLMSPLMSIQPIFESPLARPPVLQRNLAVGLLADVLRDRPGAHGMLLASIEQDAEYPFINYGVVQRQGTNAEELQQTARLASLERFDPQNIRYFSEHLVDTYEEAATIARPPLQPACRKPLSMTTGYIICVYKVFEGDDGERFERNWLYWTGARMLYQCLPKSVGLRRITLHKSLSMGDKLYTLLCECSSFMEHLQDAAYLVPALRARLCGYCSIYRVANIY